MTSTRKATPVHALVLMAVLATAAGIMQLNRSLPGSDFASSVTVKRVAPSPRVLDDMVIPREQTWTDQEEEGQDQDQEKEPPETIEQKRERFAPLIHAAASASKVEASLIAAVVTAESAFDPKAVSRTGAVGLMQLMPDTAQRYGVTDRWDPAQNIMGGAKYLYFLLKKFGDPKLAIAAYNACEGNVKKHRNKIPPFAETRAYVPRVLAYYKQYRNQSWG